MSDCWRTKKEKGERSGQDGKQWEMEMPMLVAVLVLQVCTCKILSKLHLNMCPLLHVNYISMKLLTKAALVDSQKI